MAFTLRPAAPLVGAPVIPQELIDQYVKPASAADALLVDAFRDTAIGWVENRTTVGMTSRAWQASFDAIEPRLALGRSPVIAITSIAYTGTDNLPATVVAPYVIDADGVLSTDNWLPSLAGSPVVVTFVAGHADPADVPRPFVVAALLMIGHLYDGNAADAAPATVTMLCDQDRTPVVAA